jgi:hypothetical protein
MARRSLRRSKPPKPKAPILTAEQKRRRIERLKKCIRDLQAFDPQKVQKRFGVHEVFALEAAIDKALASAFGQGTSAYMRYNRAATLDHGPLITKAAARAAAVPPDSGEPRSQDPREAQEAQAYFSEGRERSIDLLQKAICTLEDEIEELNPVVAGSRSNVEAPRPHAHCGIIGRIAEQSKAPIVLPLPRACSPHGRTVGVLDLDPVAGGAGSVGRGQSFRHDALEAQLAGVPKHHGAVLLGVLVVDDPGRRPRQ